MNQTVTLDQVRHVTEKVWLSHVTHLAKALGWKVHHHWISIHSAKGWPDLSLVRERLILAELKTDKGKCSQAQLEWLDALSKAGVEVYIWRPADWDDIVKILTRRAQ